MPVAPPEAPDEHVILDDDVTDTEQLVFVLRPAIERLLERLAGHGRALAALHVELVLRHAVGRHRDARRVHQARRADARRALARSPRAPAR